MAEFQLKSHLVHFDLKICHLVATILIIFVKLIFREIIFQRVEIRELTPTA